MSSLRNILTRLSWIAVALVVGMSVSHSAPVQGTCSPTKIKFSASALDGNSTNSQTFKNVPEASVSFTQGGSSPSCVIVSFTGMVAAPADGTVMFLRAWLNDTTAGLPGEIQFTTSGMVAARTHTINFIFPSVAPGTHVMRIQYKTNSSGQNVWVHRHNTIVHSAP